MEEEVKKLREETGMSLMDCKMALHRFDGSYIRARAYLQSGEWKRGKLINYKTK